MQKLYKGLRSTIKDKSNSKGRNISAAFQSFLRIERHIFFTSRIQINRIRNGRKSPKLRIFQTSGRDRRHISRIKKAENLEK